MDAPPIAYRRIQRVFIESGDPQRLFDFYKALGLEPLPLSQEEVFGFEIGHSELHIVSASSPTNASADTLKFSLEVAERSDLERCAQRIQEEGGQVLKQPWQKMPIGTWNLEATDPDGNGFHVVSIAEALQEQLLRQLSGQGYIREATPLEAAFKALPRHTFLPNHQLEEVYDDRAIMTKNEGDALSSCSQPAVVFAMLGQAALQEGDNVLEIGAGTGWNSALMSRLVGPSGFVTTIDLDSDTADFARSNLNRAGVTNVEVVCGDGGQGFEARAPYDAIVVTAQMPDIPLALVNQLRQGGRIVVPQWFNTAQFAGAYEKVDAAQNILDCRSVSRCAFMPLRGEFSGPIKRVVLTNMSVHMSSDALLDVDELSATLRTPHRQVTVASLSGGTSTFLEYAALTGEPLAQLYTGTHHPYCFFASSQNFALLYTTWDEKRGREILNPTLIVYGDDTVLKRIEEVAQKWNDEGRPGLDDADITVAPVGTLKEEESSYLTRKQWMDYRIRFRRVEN